MGTTTMAKITFRGEYRVVCDIKKHECPYGVYFKMYNPIDDKVHTSLLTRFVSFAEAITFVAKEIQRRSGK